MENPTFAGGCRALSKNRARLRSKTVTARPPPTVVVLGGINMDLIGVAPRLPRPGETVIGDHFYTAPGGKGANQAVAAARLGANARMVGRVGRDSFGPILLSDLRCRTSRGTAST